MKWTSVNHEVLDLESNEALKCKVQASTGNSQKPMSEDRKAVDQREQKY